jgi:hypothetical protein
MSLEFFGPPPAQRQAFESAPGGRPVPSALRTLRDDDGLRWVVYEWVAPEHSPFPGRRSLVFDAVTVVRRLSDYPAGWVLLSDAALLALMSSGR